MRGVTDPDVPWYVKVLVFIIVAYIISPLDLIPDFIPVLGLLDEAILVPLAISLAWKLLPAQVLEKYSGEPEKNWPRRLVICGIVLVLLVWLVVILTFASMIEYYS